MQKGLLKLSQIGFRLAYVHEHVETLSKFRPVVFYALESEYGELRIAWRQNGTPHHGFSLLRVIILTKKKKKDEDEKESFAVRKYGLQDMRKHTELEMRRFSQLRISSFLLNNQGKLCAPAIFFRYNNKPIT